MRRVLAAVERDDQAIAVAAFAGQLARVLDAAPDIVHAGIGAKQLRSLVGEVRTLDGDPVTAIMAEAADPEVVAVVVGHSQRHDGAPIGTVASSLLLALPQPVAVVPGQARHPDRLSRAIVPLEGSQSTTLAPLRMIELAGSSGVDIVLVHVFGPKSVPMFTDQPQHETEAWTREFVARYCPFPPRSARLQLRRGAIDREICALAREADADVVALGWSQDLAAGRAEVVRAVLETANLPVLLIPVRHAAEETASDPLATVVLT
jgi:nucleotide-binding universal stress UspA family protein